MGKRLLAVIAVPLLWSFGHVHGQEPGQRAATACPVTMLRPGEWAYGDEYLAAILTSWPSGVLELRRGGPGLIMPDGSLHMKLGWRRGVRELPLTISGKRLDANAAPLRARISHSEDIGGESSTLIFPTAGCWQVTGRIGVHEVTFVVLVRVADE